MIFRRNVKLNIESTHPASSYFGMHRSGWQYVNNVIHNHQSGKGLLFDSFLEKSFHWGEGIKKVYKQPWIGIIHIPHDMPDFLKSGQSNEQIFEKPEFIESMDTCKGLITLSDFHKQGLQKNIDVPVKSAFHPTELNNLKKFSWEDYKSSTKKQIVQIGWFLRKLSSIYLLDAPNFNKIWLQVNHIDINKNLQQEINQLNISPSIITNAQESVYKMPFLSNLEYDILLSKSIIFLDLYSASANNAIIEGMARETPILVNRNPATIEYLGINYPLFFTDLKHASELLEDEDRIHSAHIYLKNKKLKDKISKVTFIKDLTNIIKDFSK